MSTINPANLPPPDIIATRDFATELADVKSYMATKRPDLSEALNSEAEPLSLVAEVIAYIGQVKSQEFNDNARGLLLAFARGANLDHIGTTYFQTERLTITPADETTVPPTPAVMESDDAYLERILIAGDGYSTAGTEPSYRYHALSADGDVKDVGVTSPSAGVVTVTVLSHSGDGTAPQATLAAVDASLGNDVVPMTDNVVVQSASIVTYTINATLTFYPGFDAATVRQNAEASVTEFVNQMHRLGIDITRVRLASALAVEGVQDVTFNNTVGTDFVDTITIAETQAPYCAGITVLSGGVSE